jgi:hypothetical protein
LFPVFTTPSRYDDFIAWFATDDNGADYLEWLR